MSGCGCGGSTRRTPQPSERDGAKATPIRKRREGGPGEPGYYWSGVKRSKKNDPGSAAA